MTWLAVRAFLGSVPKWAWYALAAVALVIAAALYINGREKAAVEADRSAAKAEAVSRAREADERAETASEGVREDIERSNADAKAAADRSDDPLAAALDRLRAQKDRDRKAAGRAD